MTKFDRVLSKEDAALVAESVGFYYGSEDEFQALAEGLEQAMLAKLVERQEPAAWKIGLFVDVNKDAVTANVRNPDLVAQPLYDHPVPISQAQIDRSLIRKIALKNGFQLKGRDLHEYVYQFANELISFCADIWDDLIPTGDETCVSQETDKTACVSESGESDTQHHLEYIKRYQKWRRGEDKTMDEAGIEPKQLGEALDWLIGFAENHTEASLDMVGEKSDTQPVAWLNEETGDIISDELAKQAVKLHQSYDVPLYKKISGLGDGTLINEGTKEQHRTTKNLLDWSEPKPPTEDVSRYDHVTAETPIGDFYIEWKSWKKYDLYTVCLDGEWLGNGADLSDAKRIAQEHIEGLASVLSVYTNHIPDAGKMVPDGWQLTPTQATDDMYLGFCHVRNDIEPDEFREAYRAVLAAAPKYKART